MVVWPWQPGWTSVLVLDRSKHISRSDLRKRIGTAVVVSVSYVATTIMPLALARCLIPAHSMGSFGLGIQMTPLPRPAAPRSGECLSL